jgi:hypothetical protein
MRRQKSAALVLATSYEVWPGVHSGDLAAFQIAHEDLLAVPIQIGGGVQLHVVLLDPFVDGLFALPVGRAAAIGRYGCTSRRVMRYQAS